MAGTVTLEKLGKPGVFICYDTFRGDAKNAAEDNGMPAVRMVDVPSSVWYAARATVEKMRPEVEKVFNGIVDALARPLSEDESKPKLPVGEKIKTIRVAAGNHDLAFEKFNDIFLENRWGDGLPLVPPTPERVNLMLSSTSRSPKEVLGSIAPKNGIATVRNIAINSVMAGAKPQYFPVILAAMEALADKDFDNRHVLQSAGSFNLMIVASGPIAKEIKMHSGIGFLGHGWHANNTIGRAVRLSTLNIGQSWPGVNDMGILGRPSAHTFYTFAENADDSAWAPYHVTQGFKSDDSCVTVFVFGYGYGIAGLSGYGGGISTFSGGEILDNIVQDINNDRRYLILWDPDPQGFMPAAPGHGKGPQKHMIILFPAVVKELARDFPTQQALQEEIYKRTSVPFEKLSSAEIAAVKAGIEGGVVPAELRSVFEESLKPGGKIPVLVSPEDVHIFVAGGAPGYAFGTTYFRVPLYSEYAIMTKPIHGATLTRAGH